MCNTQMKDLSLRYHVYLQRVPILQTQHSIQVFINCVSSYFCVVLANRRCNFLCCSFQSCWYPFFILCPTLPVSLDCPFLIATLAFSYLYLYRTDIRLFTVRQKQKHTEKKSQTTYIFK